MRRALLLAMLVGSISLGCGEPEGFAVWVTNETDDPFLLTFEGRGSLGDIGVPDEETYRVDAGVTDRGAPFAYVFDGVGTGEVVLRDNNCKEVFRQSLPPGDYRLAIGDVVTVEELGFAQRPTNL